MACHGFAIAEPNIGKPDRPIDSREIDFLNTRRAIIKKRSVPHMIAAGAAAAFVVLGGIAWYWLSHSSLDSEIERLQAQLASEDASVKISDNLIKNKNEIEAFVDKRSTGWTSWRTFPLRHCHPVKLLCQTFSSIRCR